MLASIAKEPSPSTLHKRMTLTMLMHDETTPNLNQDGINMSWTYFILATVSSPSIRRYTVFPSPTAGSVNSRL